MFSTGFRRIVSILLLVTLFLSGCGTQSETRAGTVLRIWYSTDDPVERAWSQELTRQFESSHPGVSVQLTDYSFEDLNTKLQLALSGGNPPDLAYVTPRGPGIPAYIGGHFLRDLTGASQRYGWFSKLRAGLLAEYNQSFSFYGAAKGHVVAVPTSLAAVGILYNKRLLTKLRLSTPSSLQAFQAALDRARAAGYTPIGMGNADGWLGDDWYVTVANASIPPAALRPEQVLDPAFSFRTSLFSRAAHVLQTWAQAKYFTHDFGGLDAQEGLDLFFRGQTLFQLVSSSENSQILQDERQTRLPVGIFAFPREHGGRVMPVSGYEGWVVPRAGHNFATATQFINYLLTPRIARFLAAQGLLPAHNVTAGTLLAPSLGRERSWQKQYLAALDTAQPGVYLDSAPIANLNATMEANVQLLLQGYEAPAFLTGSLQEVYASHGSGGSSARIDGEF